MSFLALSYVPVFLMLGVFVVHRLRVARLGQSAWKGGGFGMFSDVRRTSVTASATFVDEDGAEVSLRLPPCGPGDRAVQIPSPENVRRWAERLVDSEWQRCGDVAHLVNSHALVRPLQLTKVTAVVRRLDFDGTIGAYSSRVLFSMDARPSAEGVTDVHTPSHA